MNPHSPVTVMDIVQNAFIALTWVLFVVYARTNKKD
jgi:hypothetical protein